MPSPRILNANTVYTNAIPGKIASHGAVVIYVNPLESASPQSGLGGWAPMPRKLSAVVLIMVCGMERLASTTIDGTMFGRIYRSRIALSCSLKAIAVSTKA